MEEMVTNRSVKHKINKNTDVTEKVGDDKKRHENSLKRNESGKKRKEALSKIQVRPPSQLPDYGKYMWRKIQANMVDINGLTKIDEPNLELYCANYALYREALDEFKEYGILIETNKGLTRNPAIGVMDTATKTMRSLSTALGFDYQFRKKVVFLKKIF